MKLNKVSVTAFRSIKSSITLLIDNKVTILIGANDHGKTNLLEAILQINDKQEITEEEKNWDTSVDVKPRIEWHFSLSESDIDKLRKIVEKPEGNEEELTNTTDLLSATTSYFTVNSNQELAFYKEDVNTNLRVLSTPFEIPEQYEEEILKTRPRIELFTPVTTNLKDDITLEQLITDPFEFMQGIFHLAGLWDEKDNIFTQDPRTSKLLDEASQRLTYVLNDKWNQGRDLRWRFTHAGTNGDHVILEINDPSITSRFSRPSLRSSGFQTYFVLSMIINARKYNNLDNAFIFLFDEPGTYLHPYAQLDLQRSFEAASDTEQIIYTTHSLFLINKNHPKRNRVVNKTMEGTKIDQKPFQKNWKAVRESLGILLSNNFLIAEKTLLVEGPSDVIYILQAIKSLKKDHKVDIDLNDMSIVDAGNSENYIAMAKLMLSEGREVVALVDGDESGTGMLEKLNKSCENEIKKGHLKTFQLSPGKSIEDICCDLKTLRKAIIQVTTDLVSTGERSLADGIDISDTVKKIKPSSSATLGFTISSITKSSFKPQEKLSKLSIALEYETISEDENPKASDQAGELIKNLKKLMELKGEKSADKGVFEEIQQ